MIFKALLLAPTRVARINSTEKTVLHLTALNIRIIFKIVLLTKKGAATRRGGEEELTLTSSISKRKVMGILLLLFLVVMMMMMIVFQGVGNGTTGAAKVGQGRGFQRIRSSRLLGVEGMPKFVALVGFEFFQEPPQFHSFGQCQTVRGS